MQERQRDRRRVRLPPFHDSGLHNQIHGRLQHERSVRRDRTDPRVARMKLQPLIWREFKGFLQFLPHCLRALFGFRPSAGDPVNVGAGAASLGCKSVFKTGVASKSRPVSRHGSRNTGSSKLVCDRIRHRSDQVNADLAASFNRFGGSSPWPQRPSIILVLVPSSPRCDPNLIKPHMKLVAIHLWSTESSL